MRRLKSLNYPVQATESFFFLSGIKEWEKENEINIIASASLTFILSKFEVKLKAKNIQVD